MLDVSNCSVLTCIVCYISACGANEFQCTMGVCIDSRLYCNGEPGCPDGSDEPENCSKFPPKTTHQCILFLFCFVFVFIYFIGEEGIIACSKFSCWLSSILVISFKSIRSKLMWKRNWKLLEWGIIAFLCFIIIVIIKMCCTLERKWDKIKWLAYCRFLNSCGPLS